MAGHSKWVNIRFRKSVQDVKRGKIFTKFIREITVAARMFGGDPHTNPRLRDVIDKALSANMKRDTINNAIKRGVGGEDTSNWMEIRYEGYGPGGIAILVDCLTDNKNRTVAEVRFAFTKAGGNLGTEGSVAYLFRQQGEIYYPDAAMEEKILEISIEAGAMDVSIEEDGSLYVLSTPENFSNVKEALLKSELQYESAELTMNALTQVTLDEETAATLLRLIDALEELDDVQNVYSNAHIPDEILARL